MHRNIKSLVSEGPSLCTTTEANLFLCSSCYRLYQEETNLIQLEHQIGVLTKNQGLASQSSEESTIASPKTSPVLRSTTVNMPKKTMNAPTDQKTSPKLSVVTSPNPSGRDSKLSSSRPSSARPSSARSSSARPSSAPSLNKSRSSSKKLSLFSISSDRSRPSISSLPEKTASERFRNRHGSSISVQTTQKTEEAIKKEKEEEAKTRSTVYQLAKPRQLVESYTNTFLTRKKIPVQLLSESDIRDKFRDKNHPSNHTVPFFVEKDSRSLSINKPSSLTSAYLEGRKTYQKISDPPMGNVVSRTDVPLHLTVCRLAVNLHEVVDLPVAIFEAYENFSLCYVALGRRVDAPCTKSSGYRRCFESTFKEAEPIVNHINYDSDSDSSSSTSSTSSSSASSGTNSKDQNKKKRKSKSNNKKESDSDGTDSTDSDSHEEDDDAFGESCASVEKEVVVGNLECRLFKVSYVMINGDAQSQEYHEPLTQFFQDFKCITVVLCATLKPSAVIAENNWSIPKLQDLSKTKASRLKTQIRDIRRGTVTKDNDRDSLKPLPRRRPSSSMFAPKSPSKASHSTNNYDPRAPVEYFTESGCALPSNAIAYGNIPLDQFKGNTVKRLDVGIPLTYTIQHLPLARTVPMLKGMVGFDRPLYPIDIWALPYSMLQLRERNAFVPLVENQYSSTIPLPSEWVNVKMQNLDARRGKAMFKQRSSVSSISGSMQGSSADLTGASQKRIDIDGMKRNAPTIHHSQARSEINKLATSRNTTTNISNRMQYEIDLERQPGSIWCVCVQVLSAHHIHSDDDFYSEKKMSFECLFHAFGDKTRLIGDLVEADGGDGGEVKFVSNETKFLFSSSVSALENMFECMEPVTLKFRPLKDNPNGDLPQYARTMSICSPVNRRQSLRRSERKIGGLGRSNSMINKSSSGQINFKNLHKERFMEVSVPVQQDVVTDEIQHRNEMTPPYAHVILKLYRVGPPTIAECGNWLPPRMIMGHDVDRGVERVVYSYHM